MKTIPTLLLLAAFIVLIIGLGMDKGKKTYVLDDHNGMVTAHESAHAEVEMIDDVLKKGDRLK